MGKLTPLMVRVDQSIKDGLKNVRDNKGISIQAQARFAFLAWLESHGLSVKAEPAPADDPDDA